LKGLKESLISELRKMSPTEESNLSKELVPIYQTLFKTEVIEALGKELLSEFAVEIKDELITKGPNQNS
jgi:hypothetical protein